MFWVFLADWEKWKKRDNLSFIKENQMNLKSFMQILTDKYFVYCFLYISYHKRNTSLNIIDLTEDCIKALRSYTGRDIFF